MTSNLGTPQLHEAILAQQAALEAGDLDEDEPPLDAEAVVRRLPTPSFSEPVDLRVQFHLMSSKRCLFGLQSSRVARVVSTASLTVCAWHDGDMCISFTVVSVACGASHSMAVTDRGAAFTWGKNNQVGTPVLAAP